MPLHISRVAALLMSFGVLTPGTKGQSNPKTTTGTESSIGLSKTSWPSFAIVPVDHPNVVQISIDLSAESPLMKFKQISVTLAFFDGAHHEVSRKTFLFTKGDEPEQGFELIGGKKYMRRFDCTINGFKPTTGTVRIIRIVSTKTPGLPAGTTG